MTKEMEFLEDFHPALECAQQLRNSSPFYFRTKNEDNFDRLEQLCLTECMYCFFLIL